MIPDPSTHIAHLEHPLRLERHVFAPQLVADLDHSLGEKRLLLGFGRGLVGPQTSDEVLQRALEHPGMARRVVEEASE